MTLGGASYPPGPSTTFSGYYMWRMRRDPLGFLASLARDYGDISHFLSGRQHVYFVNHPDLIKEVLVTKNAVFTKGRTMTRVRSILGDGLLTSDGEIHRTHRRLVQPAMQPRRMADYGRVMVRTTAAIASTWRDGRDLDVTREMQRLTLRIVGRTLFDADFEPTAHIFDTAIDAIMREADRRLLPSPVLLDRVSSGWNRRYARQAKRVDAAMRALTSRRLEAPEGDDMLWALVSAARDGVITDAELRDEILTMLLAGHVTMTSLLSWIWQTLAEHPEVEASLHAEVDALGPLADDLSGLEERLVDLPYARMLLMETLRVSPPVWALSRRTREACDVGGYNIPEGALVTISPYVLHRDARTFPDPARFDPLRWIDSAESARSKFAFLPFSAGPRGCIGEPLALLEGVLVVAAIARRWRFRPLPGGRAMPYPGLILRPRKGIRMRAEARR